MRELRRLRARVRQIWPMPESVPSDADVIYCEYAVDLSRRLPWIPGDAAPRSSSSCRIEEPIQADALAHATPDAVLSRPLTANAVAVEPRPRSQPVPLRAAPAQQDRKLDENLRSIRTVERAKAILMTTRRLQEDEAYGLIRRQAMDRRVSASTVAAAIVDSFELLGYSNKVNPR